MHELYPLIARLEGVSRTAYRDSGGAWTIGVGHLLTKSERASGKIVIKGVPVRYSGGLTSDQVGDLFEQDAAWAVEVVDSSVDVPLTGPQRAALISFTFNVGAAAFRGSTLLKKLNAGDYAAVPAQMRRWIYDNGARVDGLVNRREMEIEVWGAVDGGN